MEGNYSPENIYFYLKGLFKYILTPRKGGGGGAVWLPVLYEKCNKGGGRMSFTYVILYYTFVGEKLQLN